jgi:hypothetical protein
MLPGITRESLNEVSKTLRVWTSIFTNIHHYYYSFDDFLNADKTGTS